ncbi:hypothetical protein ROE7235_02768 [Roseibaca ekhonensis]|uniref:Uncharacterized protein n=1 Tax=Roseinatronobacter ekhonensis TaxID=254356 RepID=A0A3B0MAX0_9RHOB|nr:hypothetical protein ROE7235_02768 [Roseibaca ekhonensis]
MLDSGPAPPYRSQDYPEVKPFRSYAYARIAIHQRVAPVGAKPV